MNSSRRETTPRQVPPPPNSRAGTPYTRFIPREELQSFAAWTPESFGAATALSGTPWAGTAQAGERPLNAAGTSAEPAHSAAATAALDSLRAELAADHQAQLKAQVAAARTQGYQDGYRDGLVALESFKQSFASQTSSQMGQVLAALDTELGALEQQMAGSVARVATELARQVVRSELSVRPALVAQVAREAVNAVLMSARQITVLVNPDDHALVATGCEEALAARGARLLAQASVARGGCRVESDAGVIDARISARWLQATHALGTGVTWDDGPVNPAAPGDDA
jgi:flagellar assembly protein FliH